VNWDCPRHACGRPIQSYTSQRPLLQTRTRVLNGALDQLICCRYPAFRDINRRRRCPRL
jgi:hypothetical protein